MSSFITANEYLALHPLSKWTRSNVLGKSLHDIIDTTALLMLRKSMRQSSLYTSEIIENANPQCAAGKRTE